jgi:hypothetical protein
VRTYYEATDKRIYVVREVLDDMPDGPGVPPAQPSPVALAARNDMAGPPVALP